MSMSEEDRTTHLGESLEMSRDELLTAATRFPAYPSMVIDGLTDEEEAAFLDAINAL